MSDETQRKLEQALHDEAVTMKRQRILRKLWRIAQHQETPEKTRQGERPKHGTPTGPPARPTRRTARSVPSELANA